MGEPYNYWYSKIKKLYKYGYFRVEKPYKYEYFKMEEFYKYEYYANFAINEIYNIKKSWIYFVIIIIDKLTFILLRTSYLKIQNKLIIYLKNFRFR